MASRKILIGPSVLASDLSNLLSESTRVIVSGADFLHLDVMDGHFVPNITFGAPIISCLRRNLPLPIFDVHLMVSEPERWVDDMARAGASIFTFHIEATSDAGRLIESIKSHGMKAGIAIKPGTDVTVISPFIDIIDLVLVMTVEPGFGGQQFMKGMMSKIEYLRRIRPDIDIEVDGGITPETAKYATAAGANMLVAGTSVFRSDPKIAMKLLRGEESIHGANTSV